MSTNCSLVKNGVNLLYIVYRGKEETSIVYFDTLQYIMIRYYDGEEETRSTSKPRVSCHCLGSKSDSRIPADRCLCDLRYASSWILEKSAPAKIHNSRPHFETSSELRTDRLALANYRLPLKIIPNLSTWQMAIAELP